ncbi:MAG: LysR family transcriptional regulator [Gammaproteobacteria bacterium]|nr:LysR family transcriptional regulator [Gammaproteobacteria bacterium]
MNSINWNLIRSFLSVAHEGSLSAACKSLGVSQPTLSRDIQAIEKSLKLQLFKRSTQGLLLTEAGRNLVEAAAGMDSAAQQFERLATGLSEQLEGDVRISANEIIGIFLLPAAIAEFRRQHPGVQVECVIDNHASNISKREADIALRMFRPSQVDLVAQRLPDMSLGFFAHQDYVQQYGDPQSVDEIRTHSLIGFDRNTEFIDEASKMGMRFSANDFALRTDHMLAQINLARSGAGIVGTHIRLAQHWPELKPVMQWIPLPALEFWLVCHSDTQYNSRIRALMRFLANWFREDAYRGILL